MAALAQVAGVPHPEPKRDAAVVGGTRWITTDEAAQHLGISDRAVRKRISSGALTARLIGGRWLIDVKELARAASAA
jgi:excisionase family DNA binding protein